MWEQVQVCYLSGRHYLGASRVHALDLDQVAVVAAKENIELNHVEETVEVKHGNLTGLCKRTG